MSRNPQQFPKLPPPPHYTHQVSNDKQQQQQSEHNNNEKLNRPAAIAKKLKQGKYDWLRKRGSRGGGAGLEAETEGAGELQARHNWEIILL